MRTKILFILIVCTFAMVLSTSPAAADDPLDVKDPKPARKHENQGQGSDHGRVMIVTNSAVTDSMREELRKHGKIHGVIDRYNIVAFSPKGQQEREAVEDLDFVTSVTKDGRLSLHGIGTWDLDMINAVNVEESVEQPGSSPFIDPADVDAREVDEKGDGVYVAVIDTGLVNNWRDFLPASQVDTGRARAFIGGGATGETFVPLDEPKPAKENENRKSWERDTSGHGMVVASHITGFHIGDYNFEGVAPHATIIPISVFPNGESLAWETHIIAALAYVTELKLSGEVDSVVINMSLGGSEPVGFTKQAIDAAIDAGVIVVASAGNEGEAGMGWPAAYPEVISVGAIGWTQQFRDTVGTPDNPKDFFWALEDVDENPDDVDDQVYVPDFSSRAIPSLSSPFGVEPQQLDGVAPGVRTAKPDGHGPKAGLFFENGTSFAAPLVTGIAALMLERNGNLTQSDVEDALKAGALPIADSGTKDQVLDRSGNPTTHSWDTDCNGSTCDPVGAGLFRAKEALAATP